MSAPGWDSGAPVMVVSDQPGAHAAAVYGHGRIAGIPGLRFLSHNKRHVSLVHLPTQPVLGLNLIDSHTNSRYTVRMTNIPARRSSACC
ncbi:hypothetical protein ACFRFU_52225 [Streptomyces sp. NPDC056704]|uniref:hypothetical protein n=1 Tax=Streptomyces sp. NPDC056704 TaxID=3345917 RepID=UPI003691DF8C